MIEVTTRSLLRSGGSYGVVLSPKWLRKHDPHTLQVLYLNGMVLVFPSDQSEQIEAILGESVAKILQAAILTQESDNLTKSPAASEPG